MCMGKVYGTLTYPHGKEGFAEAERKSLSYLCAERVGLWKRDVGNDGIVCAKTTKNGKHDDQTDVRC